MLWLAVYYFIKSLFGVCPEATAADGTDVQHLSSTSSQGKQVTTDLSDADMVEILGNVKMMVFQSRISQQIIGLYVDSLSQPPESEDLQAQLKAWNKILEYETWRLDYHMGLIKKASQP